MGQARRRVGAGGGGGGEVCVRLYEGGREGGKGGWRRRRRRGGQLRTKVHKDYEFRQLSIRTAYMTLLIYNLYASRLHIKQH